MRRTLALILAVGLAFAPVVSAQWDPTKPATNDLITSAPLRTNWNALAEALGGVNLVADPTFLIWAAGDAAAPTHWSLTGAGAAVARAGTGLADTSRKVGDWSAKVTSGGGADAFLIQQILPTAAFTKLNYLQGQYVSAGCYVKASVAASVNIGIYDGVGVTYHAVGHTGGGTWEWLSLTRQLDAAATELTLRLVSDVGGVVGYFSGCVVTLGSVVPQDFQPAPVEYRTHDIFISGNLTAGALKAIWMSPRPGIIKDVELTVLTAPAGQPIIVDVNTWDGAADTSMFATRPQIAVGAGIGGAQPDSTYARRCFSVLLGTAFPTGGRVTIDIDQVGVGTAGANLTVQLRYLTFARPLESWLAYNNIN